MNQALVQETLHGLGLSPNEAKVYTTMLSHPDFSASDAASAADVPTQMIYRILDRMMEKGFCMEVSSRPRRFTITDPSVAIDTLVHNKDYLLQTAHEMLPELRGIFNEGRAGENGVQGVKILRDLETAVRMINQLNSEAREEILFFVKPPFIGDMRCIERQVESLPQLENPYHPAIRAVYQVHDHFEDHVIPIERSIELSGEQARVAQHVPIKAQVYDRKKVIINIRNELLQPIGWNNLVVEHQDLADVLVAVFERLWINSEDYWMWKEKNMV